MTEASQESGACVAIPQPSPLRGSLRSNAFHFGGFCKASALPATQPREKNLGNHPAHGPHFPPRKPAAFNEPPLFKLPLARERCINGNLRRYRQIPVAPFAAGSL